MLVPGKDGFSEVTYTDLYKVTERVAVALAGLGLKKGDRVVILSENCPEWAFADWAGQTLGLIVVPIFAGFGAGMRQATQGRGSAPDPAGASAPGPALIRAGVWGGAVPPILCLPSPNERGSTCVKVSY